MKIKNLLLIIIISLYFKGFGQNLNMVIDVNNKLVTSEIGNLYLNFEYNDETSERVNIGYHPGELILQNDSWQKIKSEKIKKTSLVFDYYTYKNGKQKIAHFEVEMKKYHFEKTYLVLHIYDFRERKYRKKYSCLTSDNYITEFNFPQSGILVTCG